jgi:hypothetical protein
MFPKKNSNPQKKKNEDEFLFEDVLKQPLVICNVMSFLDLNSLRNLSLCNKRLNKLFKKDQVWLQRFKKFQFKFLILDDLSKEKMKGVAHQKMKKYMELEKMEEDETVIDLNILLISNANEEETMWKLLEKNLPLHQIDQLFFFKTIKNEKIFKFQLFDISDIHKLPNVRLEQNRNIKTFLNTTIVGLKFYERDDTLSINTKLS